MTGCYNWLGSVEESYRDPVCEGNPEGMRWRREWQSVGKVLLAGRIKRCVPMQLFMCAYMHVGGVPMCVSVHACVCVHMCAVYACV